jgi:hypothetical protein
LELDGARFISSFLAPHRWKKLGGIVCGKNAKGTKNSFSFHLWIFGEGSLFVAGVYGLPITERLEEGHFFISSIELISA